MVFKLLHLQNEEDPNQLVENPIETSELCLQYQDKSYLALDLEPWQQTCITYALPKYYYPQLIDSYILVL